MVSPQNGTAVLNPFRTAVPFWGQTTSKLSGLPPKRDCGSKRVERGKLHFYQSAGEEKNNNEIWYKFVVAKGPEMTFRGLP